MNCNDRLKRLEYSGVVRKERKRLTSLNISWKVVKAESLAGMGGRSASGTETHGA